MDDIYDILRKFKKIQPGQAFARESRERILREQPRIVIASPSVGALVGRFFMNSLQFGTAIALTVLFLLLVSGGFSRWNILTPFGFSSLDPASLRAEAEAVDTQIKLTDVAYADPQTQEQKDAGISAPVPASAVQQASQVLSASQNAAKTIPSATPEPAVPPETTFEISIDEALENLEK